MSKKGKSSKKEENKSFEGKITKTEELKKNALNSWYVNDSIAAIFKYV